MHAPVRPSPSSLHGLKRTPATRRRVLERDGHRCVLCGSDGNLRVHHLRRVADGGSNDDKNLVTLCDDCHLEHHRAEEEAREIEEDAEDMLLLGGYD